LYNTVRFLSQTPHKHFPKEKGEKRKQVASRIFKRPGYKSPLAGVAQPLCARALKNHDNLAALFAPFPAGKCPHSIPVPVAINRQGLQRHPACGQIQWKARRRPGSGNYYVLLKNRGVWDGQANVSLVTMRKAGEGC